MHSCNFLQITVSEMHWTAHWIFRIGFMSQATVGDHSSSKFRTATSSSEVVKVTVPRLRKASQGNQVTAAASEESLSDIMSPLPFKKYKYLNKTPHMWLFQDSAEAGRGMGRKEARKQLRNSALMSEKISWMEKPYTQSSIQLLDLKGNTSSMLDC